VRDKIKIKKVEHGCYKCDQYPLATVQPCLLATGRRLFAIYRTGKKKPKKLPVARGLPISFD
jgi:hypothetical protein